MAWLSVDQSLPTHRKTLEMAALLDLPPVYVVGHLTAFWLWALDNAPDGSLYRVSPRVIAIASQWQGNPTDLVNAMLQAGFVDEDENGLSIHDWQDYAGKLIDRREANKQRMRAARAEHVQNTCRTRAGATEQNRTVHNTTEQINNYVAASAAEPAPVEVSSKEPKEPRADQQLWCALRDALGSAPSTRQGRGAWNSAIAEMRRAEPTVLPSEVAALVETHRRLWPNVSVVTPTSLAKHLHTLRAPPAPVPIRANGRPVDRSELAQPGWVEDFEATIIAVENERRAANLAATEPNHRAADDANLPRVRAPV
jgi:hypothetical protein